MVKGEKVYFGRTHGEKTLGEIVSVNTKTITVRQLEARTKYPVGTKWRVATSFVTSVTGGPTVVASVPAPKLADVPASLGRPEKAVMEDILGVYCRMSPENISCDGEASLTYQRRRLAQLERQLKLLFAELGREVLESEAYAYANVRGAPWA